MTKTTKERFFSFYDGFGFEELQLHEIKFSIKDRLHPSMLVRYQQSAH